MCVSKPWCATPAHGHNVPISNMKHRCCLICAHTWPTLMLRFQDVFPMLLLQVNVSLSTTCVTRTGPHNLPRAPWLRGPRPPVLCIRRSLLLLHGPVQGSRRCCPAGEARESRSGHMRGFSQAASGPSSTSARWNHTQACPHVLTQG